jgi:hypothetical protein
MSSCGGMGETIILDGGKDRESGKGNIPWNFSMPKFAGLSVLAFSLSHVCWG